MRKITMLLIVLVSVTGIGCNRASQQGAGAKKKLTIAVIPKGTTHEFWKSIVIAVAVDRWRSSRVTA